MKPNTYTQIPIHAVFAVKHRECLIAKPWRDQLHQYISGILASETRYALAVGGWQDHVHIFFEMKPTQTVANILDVVKAKSSGWVNQMGFLSKRFNWQDGYGAFGHSRSQVDQVIKYIMGQEAHHRNHTFREEYVKMLDDNGIRWEAAYLFEFLD